MGAKKKSSSSSSPSSSENNNKDDHKDENEDSYTDENDNGINFDNSSNNLDNIVIQELKSLYTNKLLPIEKKYLFHNFNSSEILDSELSAKPTVLLIGQYSTGKTSFIRHLIGTSIIVNDLHSFCYFLCILSIYKSVVYCLYIHLFFWIFISITFSSSSS